MTQACHEATGNKGPDIFAPCFQAALYFENSDEGILVTAREFYFHVVAHDNGSPVTFFVLGNMGQVNQKRFVRPEKIVFTQQVIVVLEGVAGR
jgi:hypothetical protein